MWLSEVMLQQTQVQTVLEYYARFLQRFPTVSALASGQPDDVLALWSGLGYYSRARNLHRCAQQVVNDHGGKFPSTAAQLQTLAGIGPSTAAAIASICFSERVTILDGNVRRVLTRVLAFSGDLAVRAHERQLWALATSFLPDHDLTEGMPRYTQGLMDLGATVCTRRQPACAACPVQSACQGFAAGEPERFPVKSRKLKRSVQMLGLLWARRPDGSVWLERRPDQGIWGGLYCLPVFGTEDAILDSLPERLKRRAAVLGPVKHVLTHKDLQLYPVVVQFSPTDRMPVGRAVPTAPKTGGWFAVNEWPALGLPAPIRKLLTANPG